MSRAAAPRAPRAPAPGTPRPARARPPTLQPALAAAALLGAGLLAGCVPGEPPHRPNVLLVVVDTLRADRMSLYGYPRPTTPRLEVLAREAVVFDEARSQAGCTFPSVNSLLTSRHPALFILDPGATMAIPGAVTSLPEILLRHGYATAAVSASSVVRSTPSRVNPAGGFGRGFETFDESCEGEPASCVNARALGLALSEPWLLYLHYMDPHSPYRPPPGHPRRFAGASPPEDVQGWARRGETRPVVRRLYHGEGRFAYTERDLAHLSDLYDEEVAYFDSELGRLLDALDRRGLFDSTLIALAADHGEALYEHGDFSHCRDIAYETVLKTPLVLRLPGRGEGLRRSALAENLDLVPTLLDYLGIPVEGLPFEGRSLRPAIEADRPVRPLSFGNQGRHRTATDGAEKLLFDLAAGTGRLFDLAADPGETRDLSAERPEAARRLTAALLAWLERSEGPAAASGDGVERAREWEERLRALGYL